MDKRARPVWWDERDQSWQYTPKRDDRHGLPTTSDWTEVSTESSLSQSGLGLAADGLAANPGDSDLPDDAVQGKAGDDEAGEFKQSHEDRIALNLQWLPYENGYLEPQTTLEPKERAKYFEGDEVCPITHLKKPFCSCPNCIQEQIIMHNLQQGQEPREAAALNAMCPECMSTNTFDSHLRKLDENGFMQRIPSWWCQDCGNHWSIEDRGYMNTQDWNEMPREAAYGDWWDPHAQPNEQEKLFVRGDPQGDRLPPLTCPQCGEAVPPQTGSYGSIAWFCGNCGSRNNIPEDKKAEYGSLRMESTGKVDSKLISNSQRNSNSQADQWQELVAKKLTEVDIPSTLPRTAAENVMYHVCPAFARRSIECHGIDPSRSQHGRWFEGAKGFYAFTDPEEAKWYRDYHGPSHDIWEVTATHPTTPDWELTNDPDQETSAVYHPAPVGPENVRPYQLADVDDDHLNWAYESAKRPEANASKIAADWQNGACHPYAVALTQLYPHLQFGAVEWPNDHYHNFAHDETHAYDSLGAHPLSTYEGPDGYMELNVDPEMHGVSQPELVEEAKRHIRAQATPGLANASSHKASCRLCGKPCSPDRMGSHMCRECQLRVWSSTRDTVELPQCPQCNLRISAAFDDLSPEAKRWATGDCAQYAYALQDIGDEQERPLRLGVHESQHGPEHVFAHDDENAYDIFGTHPLPYQREGFTDRYDVEPSELEEFKLADYYPDEDKIAEAYEDAAQRFASSRPEPNASLLTRGTATSKTDGIKRIEGKIVDIPDALDSSNDRTDRENVSALGHGPARTVGTFNMNHWSSVPRTADDWQAPMPGQLAIGLNPGWIPGTVEDRVYPEYGNIIACTHCGQHYWVRGDAERGWCPVCRQWSDTHSASTLIDLPIKPPTPSASLMRVRRVIGDEILPEWMPPTPGQTMMDVDPDRPLDHEDVIYACPRCGQAAVARNQGRSAFCPRCHRYFYPDYNSRQYGYYGKNAEDLKHLFDNNRDRSPQGISISATEDENSPYSRLYHGSPTPIQGDLRSIWLTTDPKEARDYAGIGTDTGEGHVYEFSHSFSNPFDPNDGRVQKAGLDPLAQRILWEELANEGYDHVVKHLPEDNRDPSDPHPERHMIVALDPSKLKEENHWVIPNDDYDWLPHKSSLRNLHTSQGEGVGLTPEQAVVQAKQTIPHGADYIDIGPYRVAREGWGPECVSTGALMDMGWPDTTEEWHTIDPSDRERVYERELEGRRPLMEDMYGPMIHAEWDWQDDSPPYHDSMGWTVHQRSENSKRGAYDHPDLAMLCPACGKDMEQVGNDSVGRPQWFCPHCNTHKTGAMTRTKKLEWAKSLEDKFGPDTSQVEHTFPNGWTIRRIPDYGSLNREGELMSHCWAHSFWANPQKMQENAGYFPGYRDHHDEQGNLRNIEEADMRATVQGFGNYNARLPYYSLRDPDNFPHVSFHLFQGSPWGMYGAHNAPAKPEYRQMINEAFNGANGVRTAKSRSLYHGTLIDHLPSIEALGVSPEVGDFVRDAYGDYDPEEDFSPVSFWADKQNLQKSWNAITHHVAIKLRKPPSQVSADDIKNHGLLVKMPGQEYERTDQPPLPWLHPDESGWVETPSPAIEPGDYFSDSSQKGVIPLTGAAMMRVFQRAGVLGDPWEDPDYEEPEPPYEKSRLGAATRSQMLDEARKWEEFHGQPDMSKVVHEFPDGWTIRKLQNLGDVNREGQLMSNCWAANNYSDGEGWGGIQGPDPFCVEWPSYYDHIDKWNQLPKDETGKPTVEGLMQDNPYAYDWAKPVSYGYYYSLRDPDNIPHVSMGGENAETLGRHNSDPKEEYLARIRQWQNKPEEGNWLEMPWAPDGVRYHAL